jgi:hypothetical protein
MIKKIVVTYHAGYFGWLVCGGFAGWCVTQSRTTQQTLVKMSTRNIPGSKGGWCVRLTTSPSSRAGCREIWEPKPPRILWATPGLLRDSFTFTFFTMRT